MFIVTEYAALTPGLLECPALDVRQLGRNKKRKEYTIYINNVRSYDISSSILPFCRFLFSLLSFGVIREILITVGGSTT